MQTTQVRTHAHTHTRTPTHPHAHTITYKVSYYTLSADPSFLLPLPPFEIVYLLAFYTRN